MPGKPKYTDKEIANRMDARLKNSDNDDSGNNNNSNSLSGKTSNNNNSNSESLSDKTGNNSSESGSRVPLNQLIQKEKNLLEGVKKRKLEVEHELKKREKKATNEKGWSFLNWWRGEGGKKRKTRRKNKGKTLKKNKKNKSIRKRTRGKK